MITKEAKTSKGLFTVHQIKERYYYEIPKNELGKDLLWNSQIAKTTAGAGYGGGAAHQPRDPLGTQGQSRPHARGGLQPDGATPTSRSPWP